VDVVSYVRGWLPRVSRSFAPSIARLAPDLEIPIGVAYLLCRVVDTVEDSELPWEQKEGLFDSFVAALHGQPRQFVSDAESVFAQQSGDDVELTRDSGVLFDHFFSLNVRARTRMLPAIEEMARGMKMYSKRREESELVVLEDEADLHTYCHFVAGTVGEILTALFTDHEHCSDVEALWARTEDFAQALQRVNIAKDLAEDHQRGWQFLPRSMMGAMDPADLLDPAQCEAALDAHEAMLDGIIPYLESALDYSLLLPASGTARTFCLIPLMLAVATMSALRRNPAVLDPRNSVKIPREEALRIFQFVDERADSTAAMRALFESLK